MVEFYNSVQGVCDDSDDNGHPKHAVGARGHKTVRIRRGQENKHEYGIYVHTASLNWSPGGGLTSR